MEHPPFLGKETTIKVGCPVVLESFMQVHDRGVVFEDDGYTGYFYALDFTKTENPIVDALHIYNSQHVTDRAKASVIKILWTRDFEASALLINQRPHAIFHFGRKRGYAERPFPDPFPSSDWTHAEFQNDLRALFFPG